MVALAPDGKTFAALSAEKTLKICDAEKGTVLKELPVGVNTAYELKWCAHAPLLACGSGGKVRVWNVESQEKYLDTDEASPHTLAFTPDGNFLVAARNPSKGKGPAIQVWDLGQGKLVREFGDERIMSCLVLSDNRWLIAGELQGALSVWDLTTGKFLKRIPAHGSGVYALAESPDGEYFGSGAIDSAIWLWDAKVLPR
jgi:WD40 repeat protein